MQLRLWAWLGVVVAGACGFVQTGQGGTPEANPHNRGILLPKPEPDNVRAPQPQWTELIKRLGAEAFSEREAAQRDLDKVGYENRALLFNLAQQQIDPEVKSRLMERVDQIDEQLATDPPPISIRLNNATQDTVINDLNHALGVNLVSQGGGDLRFRLNMENASFWDVYAALNRQHPLTLKLADNAGPVLSQSIHAYDRHGGFVAYASAIVFTRTVDPQALPDQRVVSRLTLSYAIAADPRIKVLQVWSPSLHQVLDENGVFWLRDNTPAQAINRGALAQQNFWPSSVDLAIPEKPGKKLSLKGEARFVVQVSEMQFQMENLEKHANEVINVGRQTITATNLSFNANSVKMSFRVGTPGNSTDPSYVHLAVLEAGDRQMWNSALSGNGIISGDVAGAHAGPFKLVVSVPDKIKTIVMPFELKDIPIP